MPQKHINVCDSCGFEELFDPQPGEVCDWWIVSIQLDSTWLNPEAEGPTDMSAYKHYYFCGTCSRNGVAHLKVGFTDRNNFINLQGLP